MNQMLYRYWAGGKSKSALLPETDRRGGKGKSKTGNVGRKPKYDRGCLQYRITGEDEKHIQTVINKTYNAHTKYSFSDGYLLLLKKHYMESDETVGR